MKKKLALLLTAALVVATFTGCGDKTNTDQTASAGDAAATDTEETATSTVSLADFDVANLVTLGDYKGLEVVVAEPTVSEEEKNYYVNQIFTNGVKEEDGIKDRAVADGDTVYISYVGTKDGVAFDGGTSEGTSLTIGSNSYIDGFESGLVGAMPGDSVELNLTFPEVYQNNPDLAGQPVVFTVQVLYIFPEMSDESIAAQGNETYSTITELEQYVYDNLMQQAQSNYDSKVQNSLANTVIENATFEELPKEWIQACNTNFLTNLQNAALNYGIDVETYAQQAFGSDAASVASTFAEMYAKQAIAFQAIADVEDLNVTDEELDAKLMEYVNQYGLGSIEELIGTDSKEVYRERFMLDNVMAFLQENATVKAE